MEENKQVVAEWKALNQPRLQEIKKANPELYSAVNLALQYLNQKLGGEELPEEVELPEEIKGVTISNPLTLNELMKTTIYLPTSEMREEFQKILFDLGGKWDIYYITKSQPNETKIMPDTLPFYSIDNKGRLDFDGSMDIFDTYGYKDITQEWPEMKKRYVPSSASTKQWTLEDFKNIKIIVDTPEKSRKFQELFLGLGGEWSRIDNPRTTEVANTNKLYLVTNGTKLLFFNELKTFNEQTDLKEIFYDDIFNSSPSQKTWTKDDFLNKKIVLDTRDKSEKFQEFVYSLGLKWQSGENKIPILTNKKYVKINNFGELSFCEAKKDFDRDNKQEIFYDDIFPSESQATTPEPSTSTEQKKYGLPIETYPTYFSFPIPGFSANTGDRKSPTQSAGELRRWYFTLDNVAQIEYARELDRARFKGNDGNWYALITGKSGVWSWKKTTPPPTQYTPPAASSSSSSSASTSFSSTSYAQPAQPVAKPATNYKPEDLIGREIYYKGNYKIVKILKVNPKTVKYQITNSLKDIELTIDKKAIGDLLDGKVVGRAFLKDSKPVVTTQPPANSFEDSLTFLSDVELKQLYDDTEAAKAEFDAADPEYTELRLQLVAIANEMDNRNL